MKFTLATACFGILALTSANLLAQSASLEAPAAAVSGLTLNPSVYSGIRTDLNGVLAKGQNDSTVGPFIRPVLDFNYKTPTYSLELAYEFQATSGYGFGDQSSGRSLSSNVYMYNEPTLVIWAKLGDNWSLNNLLQLHVDTYTGGNVARAALGSDPGNQMKILLNPEIEYKVNPAWSVSLGYDFRRNSLYDSTLTQANGEDLTKTLQRDAQVKGAGAATVSAITNASQSPYIMVNTAVVTNKIKFNDEATLKLILRSGRQTSNVSSDGEQLNGYYNRFQSDFTANLTPKLSTMLRYRFNVVVLNENSHRLKYYHLGHVDLAYALSKTWSVNLENEFTAAEDTYPGKEALFENENYLGVKYAF